MYYADLFGPPNGTNDFSLDYVLVGMASSSRSGSRSGENNDDDSRQHLNVVESLPPRRLFVADIIR
jgi:hypothetical protein